MLQIDIQKLDKSNVEDILGLTPMQQMILIYYTTNKESEVYIEQLALEIHGDIDQEAFSRAWESVVQANQMLRTIFRWRNIMQPVQIVLKKYEVPIKQLDFCKLEQEKQKQTYEVMLEEDRRKGLDIAVEPFRITLCRLEEHRYSMILTNHHILFDGFSTRILLKEFLDAYERFYYKEQPQIVLKTGFKEVVGWYQQQDANIMKKYWIEYLKGFNTKTLLPEDRKKSGEINNVKSYELLISEELKIRLKGFIKQQGTTLSVLIYSVWGILLQRYNNSEDVVFGTVVSGRSAQIKGIENIIGLLINTLPLRMKTHPNDTVGDLLSKIHNMLIDRQEHEHMPLGEIKTCSSLDSKQNLFDSLVTIEDFPIAQKDYVGEKVLSVKGYSIFEMGNFDLTLVVTTIKDLEIYFLYNDEIFMDRTIERVSKHFLNIIEEILEKPHKEIWELDMLKNDEADRVPSIFNNSETDKQKSLTMDAEFDF